MFWGKWLHQLVCRGLLASCCAVASCCPLLVISEARPANPDSLYLLLETLLLLLFTFAWLLYLFQPVVPPVFRVIYTGKVPLGTYRYLACWTPIVLAVQKTKALIVLSVPHLFPFRTKRWTLQGTTGIPPPACSQIHSQIPVQVDFWITLN